LEFTVQIGPNVTANSAGRISLAKGTIPDTSPGGTSYIDFHQVDNCDYSSPATFQVSGPPGTTGPTRAL
jgi:hypothetical protein